MPYLGSTPNASFSSRTKQDFTANGSTTAFTLSSAVASANDIEVFVGNVRQEPTDAYTVNGTTLTMSEAPANGINFYVVFKGLEENSVVPADGSISTATIASGAITTAKVADDAITGSKIENNPTIAGNLTVSGIATMTGTLGVGTAPNATFGSHNYTQGTPTVNKPIISAYSQGNSNTAGFALFNDTGNRGIWTTGSTMRFTRTYEGNSTTDMYILVSGNVGIGTDQNAHGLSIYRHLQQYGGLMLQNGTNNTGQVFQAFHNYAGTRIGSVSQNNSAVVYNTSSDYRLKENVSYTFDATSRLKQLKPARFNWISDDTNTTIDGFLAHEVSGIVPEAITGEKDGTQDLGTVKDADGNVIETNLSETFFTERKKETVDKDGNTEPPMYPSDYVWVKTATEDVYQGIDQAKLVPLLVKTIQELEARITALESE